ncbi:UNVERIFIED_CONTAM: hypothetical protein HDU68_007771 [Siphonaria sp. JEL0065]|nr:hypothetical protein HDU68_007771 [Siphonaria sp. JEL0065]
MAETLTDGLAGFHLTNGPFLRSLGIVDALIDEIWRRIETQQLGTSTEFGVTEEGQVVTATDLSPRAAVIVFAHEWVFETVTDAERGLYGQDSLRRAVVSLVSTATNTKPPDPSHLSESQQKKSEVQYSLESLFRIAFEFDVENARGQIQKMSCVSFDAYAPALLPFANAPLFGAAVFVDGRTAKSYTILWPNWIDSDDDVDDVDDVDHEVRILEAFSPVSRAEITIMPDFSAPGFWQHHYATSKETTKFDWYVPWSDDLSHLIKNSDAVPTSEKSKDASFVTVLNVGAGNSSSVGDGMVTDGIADLVLHFDISKEVVHALAKMETVSLGEEAAAESKDKKVVVRSGLQEFVVFDAAQALPFRKTTDGTSGNQKLFDWAFDKGTFDGMLSAGLETVQKVWANLAILTDTVVLVSHGKPERRIELIEQQVGSNWEVDQCLEIDATKTTGWCYWVYICKQKEA